MTATLPQTDALLNAAVAARRAKDVETMRELSRANLDHYGVQIEAAHLCRLLRQGPACLRYVGAALKADPAALGKWAWWDHLSGAYALIGDQGEAEAAALGACKVAHPSQPLLWGKAAAYAFHRGDVQEGHMRLGRSLDAFTRHPEDVKSLGETMLYLGRYKEGWEHWEGRLQMDAIREKHDFRTGQWRGEHARGKHILVWAEQGAGDTVQFLRFLHPLKERGAVIHLRVPRELIGWCAPLLAANVIASLEAEGETTGMDFHAPLLSMPLWLKQYGPNRWPGPYAPPIPLVPTPGKIGYCWRGNPRHGMDHDRSHPERAQFLWDAHATDSWVNLTAQDEDGPKGSWVETAHLIAECEAVVTVDTAIGHVAGSLGVPTIIIPQCAPEWRWGFRGSVSPWYPSVTLIRKHSLDGWPAALAQVAPLLETIRGSTNSGTGRDHGGDESPLRHRPPQSDGAPA